MNLDRNIIVNDILKNQVRNDLPDFKAGDTIKVHQKILEGSKERIQIFEGYVLKKHNNNNNGTFTVRNILFNVGVEKTFFINSPIIVKIEMVQEGIVRRSKIYFMRSRRGKSARIKPKTDWGKQAPISTKDKDSKKPNIAKKSTVKGEISTKKSTTTKKSPIKKATPIKKSTTTKKPTVKKVTPTKKSTTTKKLPIKKTTPSKKPAAKKVTPTKKTTTKKTTVK